MTVEDLAFGPPEDFLHFDRRTYYLRSLHAVTFSVSAAPMPSDCEFSFFDPNDASCQDILFDPTTSIPELFAILRQWVPQVQQSIDVIGDEILKRRCGVNDRDGLTDMTLLHYTCKSGAHGIGDAETAAKFASRLIELGADISLRSRWTNMNALHYAAYFDVPELVPVLLKASKPKDVDATCSDFEFGTALHIAASNLCLGALRSLLEHGANSAFRDDRGRVPADVVPDPVDMPLEMADAAAVAKEIKQILLDAVPSSCDLSSSTVHSYDDVYDSATLQPAGLKLGDRVLIAGQKVGTLRFCGPTQFASGQWAGIEMDEAEGKNDGSVGGIQYFKCPSKHGIFAPVSKISKALESMKTFIKSSSNKSSVSVKSQKMDLSKVTSKINTGLTLSKRSSACESFLGTDENAKPAAAKKAFYVGSSSFSSSSSSNSSYSLETKPPLPRPPRRQDAAKRSLNSSFRSKSSSLRAINGPNVRHVVETSQEQPEFQPGDRVLVVGRRSGTVRFYGKTNFAPGFWCGVELDKPHGKNDGSVAGVEYFTCPLKHGVFAPPSRVQRITGSMDSLSEISPNKLNYSFPGFRRSYSSTSTNASPKDADRRLSRSRSKKPVLRRSWSSSAASGAGDGAVKLKKGSQVLLPSSNEMAIIRYMGPADFAPGLWLGLELRNAKGKHDGSVGDKRYFHCKPNHGVLVRPSRVTYRGINGSKLVDDAC